METKINMLGEWIEWQVGTLKKYIRKKGSKTRYSRQTRISCTIEISARVNFVKY